MFSRGVTQDRRRRHQVKDVLGNALQRSAERHPGHVARCPEIRRLLVARVRDVEGGAGCSRAASRAGRTGRLLKFAGRASPSEAAAEEIDLDPFAVGVRPVAVDADVPEDGGAGRQLVERTRPGQAWRRRARRASPRREAARQSVWEAASFCMHCGLGHPRPERLLFRRVARGVRRERSDSPAPARHSARRRRNASASAWYSICFELLGRFHPDRNAGVGHATDENLLPVGPPGDPRRWRFGRVVVDPVSVVRNADARLNVTVRMHRIERRRLRVRGGLILVWIRDGRCTPGGRPERRDRRCRG